MELSILTAASNQVDKNRLYYFIPALVLLVLILWGISIYRKKAAQSRDYDWLKETEKLELTNNPDWTQEQKKQWTKTINETKSVYTAFYSQHNKTKNFFKLSHPVPNINQQKKDKKPLIEFDEFIEYDLLTDQEKENIKKPHLEIWHLINFKSEEIMKLCLEFVKINIIKQNYDEQRKYFLQQFNK